MKAKTQSRSTETTRFVSRVFAQYGSDLEQFLLNRLPRKQNCDDVAQEVYLRLLRLEHADLVRQPHAYVYYIAAQIAGASDAGALGDDERGAALSAAGEDAEGCVASVVSDDGGWACGADVDGVSDQRLDDARPAAEDARLDLDRGVQRHQPLR